MVFFIVLLRKLVKLIICFNVCIIVKFVDVLLVVGYYVGFDYIFDGFIRDWYVCVVCIYFVVLEVLFINMRDYEVIVELKYLEFSVLEYELFELNG